MKSIPKLVELLAMLSEKELPNFSGLNKIFQIILKFNFGVYPHGHRDAGKQKESEQLKLIFWHDKSGMVIGYEKNWEIFPKKSCSYTISSDKSLGWKDDLLDSLYDILEEPERMKIIRQLKIVHYHVIDIEGAMISIDHNQKYFRFTTVGPLMAYRSVIVDRTCSAVDALLGTGRQQRGSDLSIVNTMPTGKKKEVNLIFFRLDKGINDDGLEQAYELLALKPADIHSLAAINKGYPEIFPCDYLHYTHWKDKRGRWCRLQFWKDDYLCMAAHSSKNDYASKAWFVGVQKIKL